ncbi:TetR/AcrR family transcriptional regulator [Bradyrhizobium nitroreducens]|uniref:TetR/AcrR family transcriptional regulator n=1 Tax=Bradyrhizobium nitroreducens TaxID=709803 RepID=UPI0032214F40
MRWSPRTGFGVRGGGFVQPQSSGFVARSEIIGIVRSAHAEVADLPIEKALRRLVTVAIEAHRINPKLHRVLAEQIRRTGQLKDVEAYNREIQTLVRTYLESRRKEMRKVDLDAATFICVSAIEAIAYNTVLHGAEMLSEKMVRTLADETTRMVAGYLR